MEFGRKRLSGDVVLPVGMAEFGASGNHYRAQILVADQRQIGGVDHRTGRAAFAVRAMTRLAARRVHLSAAIRIALRGTGVGRGACASVP